ncbi:YcfL family protein [Undibacterium sp. Jales W-56]|uniref:YcfL family protein n=1 Tax=Undibacterium sp. Jales W-56 TaxID=2897325 RepID=UPI0021D126CD|nr:YcfL family protein [Undibacterium sp. Jales W-56]MCU6435127.1 YcfL family protein [Undibacterium sp. Jales W-56]
MTSSIKKIFILAGLTLAVQSAFAGDPVPPAISAGIAAKLMVRGELQGLQVVDLRSQRKNDVMVVQAEVTNTDVKDLRLYYRFRWTDAAGMQVGDGEVWKPLTFLGKQSQFIKGTAYGPQATDFKIEMSSEPR